MNNVVSIAKQQHMIRTFQYDSNISYAHLKFHSNLLIWRHAVFKIMVLLTMVVGFIPLVNKIIAQCKYSFGRRFLTKLTLDTQVPFVNIYR